MPQFEELAKNRRGVLLLDYVILICVAEPMATYSRVYINEKVTMFVDSDWWHLQSLLKQIVSVRVLLQTHIKFRSTNYITYWLWVLGRSSLTNFWKPQAGQIPGQTGETSK